MLKPLFKLSVKKYGHNWVLERFQPSSQSHLKCPDISSKSNILSRGPRKQIPLTQLCLEEWIQILTQSQVWINKTQLSEISDASTNQIFWHPPSVFELCYVCILGGLQWQAVWNICAGRGHSSFTLHQIWKRLYWNMLGLHQGSFGQHRNQRHQSHRWRGAQVQGAYWEETWTEVSICFRPLLGRAFYPPFTYVYENEQIFLFLTISFK